MRWFLDYEVGQDAWVLREVTLGYQITRESIERAIQSRMLYPELVRTDIQIEEWYGSHGK